MMRFVGIDDEKNVFFRVLRKCHLMEESMAAVAVAGEKTGGRRWLLLFGDFYVF